MTYAADTSVPVERSVAEIRKTVQKYGASNFGTMEEGRRAAVTFQFGGKRILIDILLPDPTDARFRRTPAQGFTRSPEQQREAWEQACRSKWRALALIVKAKREVVEAGVTTIEEEFLPFFMLPGGGRVKDRVIPDLERALETGIVAPLLALPAPRD